MLIKMADNEAVELKTTQAMITASKEKIVKCEPFGIEDQLLAPTDR